MLLRRHVSTQNAPPLCYTDSRKKTQGVSATVSEVYADILLLVNFSMDFLTLYLCSRLGERPLVLGRALLAASLGALYALAALLLSPYLPGAVSLPIDIAFCFVICRIGLYRRGEHWRVLLRLTAVYLFISALLGGVMTLLCGALNRVLDQTELQSALGEPSEPMMLFSLLAALSAGACMLWGRARRRLTGHLTVTLLLCEGERRLSLSALCDSGNLLRDPLSACAVIPVDIATAAPLLPPALLAVLQEATPTTKLPSLPDAILHRIHLLPAKGATGERLLISWPIEHIFLEDERGSRRELSARIAPIPLHAKEYAAILPTELLR